MAALCWHPFSSARSSIERGKGSPGSSWAAVSLCLWSDILFDKWVWVKIKPGDRRVWSMCPLTRATHFGYIFWTHSQVEMKVLGTMGFVPEWAEGGTPSKQTKMELPEANMQGRYPRSPETSGTLSESCAEPTPSFFGQRPQSFQLPGKTAPRKNEGAD